LSPRESQLAHADLLHQALSELKTDLPVAEFLKTHFTEPEYAELHDAVKRMVEGYDAADPDRASTLAFRDEWMARGPRRDARIAGGYGALINFLVSECRGRGAAIHLFSVVTAIEESGGRITAYCDNGRCLRSRCRNSYRAASESAGHFASARRRGQSHSE
jgi:phytoene dehydrogenase-like protein